MPSITRRCRKHKRTGGDRVNNRYITYNNAVTVENVPQSYQVIQPKRISPIRIAQSQIQRVPQPIKVTYYNNNVQEPQYATVMPRTPEVELTSYSPKQNVAHIVSPVMVGKKGIATRVNRNASPKLVQPSYITYNKMTERPQLTRSFGTRKLLRKRK